MFAVSEQVRPLPKIFRELVENTQWCEKGKSDDLCFVIFCSNCCCHGRGQPGPALRCAGIAAFVFVGTCEVYRPDWSSHQFVVSNPRFQNSLSVCVVVCCDDALWWFGVSGQADREARPRTAPHSTNFRINVRSIP